VFDAFISGGCFPNVALEYGFGLMVWWRRVVVLLGLFAGAMFCSLWDLAGLVVGVNIMVLEFGAGFFGSTRGPLFPGRALCGRGVF